MVASATAEPQEERSDIGRLVWESGEASAAQRYGGEHRCTVVASFRAVGPENRSPSRFGEAFDLFETAVATGIGL